VNRSSGDCTAIVLNQSLVAPPTRADWYFDLRNYISKEHAAASPLTSQELSFAAHEDRVEQVDEIIKSPQLFEIDTRNALLAGRLPAMAMARIGL